MEFLIKKPRQRGFFMVLHGVLVSRIEKTAADIRSSSILPIFFGNPISERPFSLHHERSLPLLKLLRMHSKKLLDTLPTVLFLRNIPRLPWDVYKRPVVIELCSAVFLAP